MKNKEEKEKEEGRRRKGAVKEGTGGEGKRFLTKRSSDHSISPAFSNFPLLMR